MALGTRSASLSGRILETLVEPSQNPDNSKALIESLPLLFGILERNEDLSIVRNIFLILNNLLTLEPHHALLRKESAPILISLFRKHDAERNQILTLLEQVIPKFDNNNIIKY